MPKPVAQAVGFVKASSHPRPRRGRLIDIFDAIGLTDRHTPPHTSLRSMRGWVLMPSQGLFESFGDFFCGNFRI